MNLSESERLRLREIFTSSNLYLRAKTQVLEAIELHVVGSSRPSENIALDLAYKEGMQRAFFELEKLTMPEGQRPSSVVPTTLQKRKTLEENQK